MFRRIFLVCTLVVVLAVPAAAEVKGIYGGLKFIDSIFSTGHLSRSGEAARAADNYSQNTIGGGIFAGYDFYPQSQIPVRAEVEYAIRTNANTSWDVEIAGVNVGELRGQWNLQTLFLNVFWDFLNSTAFTPYIGAGIGMGFINNRYSLESNSTWNAALPAIDDSFSDTRTVFAWNAGLGCAYAFNENISLDLAYRFVGLSHSETEKTVLGQKQKIGMAPYANEFSLGLRFTF
ncbi:MAG: outer membrane beta-barrel protein [Desulfovibrio sp.]|nr:outer membrane beta-barrel protein [Desulfovibrio sp.]